MQQTDFKEVLRLNLFELNIEYFLYRRYKFMIILKSKKK